jgi:hypothetical protein
MMPDPFDAYPKIPSHEDVRPHHNHPISPLPYHLQHKTGADLDEYAAQFAHLPKREKGERDVNFRPRLLAAAVMRRS